MEQFFDPAEFGTDPYAGDAVEVVALTARAAGIAKFEVAHFPALGRAAVSDLSDAAEQFLRDYTGSFEYLVSIKRSRGGMRTDGMLKGVLNCMLAEHRRREAAKEREMYAEIDREIAIADMYEREVARRQSGFGPTPIGWAVPSGRYVVEVEGERVVLVITSDRRPGKEGLQWTKVRGRKDTAFGRIERGTYTPFDRAKHDPSGHKAMLALIEGGMDAVRAGLVEYGEAFNQCGICGRTLTDPESIARKIGPICAAKIGL